MLRLFDEAAAFLPAGAYESFRHDLGLSYAQASAVLAAIAPGAIAGNVFTIAADYVSRRVVTAAGAFAFAAALGVFALAHSLTALLVASFIIGIASTAMVDAGELALLDIAGEYLAPTLARANILGAVGDLLGPAAVVVAAALGLSWRVPFAFGAVALALYGVWLATLPLPPPSRATTDDDPPPHPLRAVAQVLKDRRVWFYAATTSLLVPLDEPFLAFLIAFVEHERGLSAAAAVAVAMCSVAGELFGYARQARARNAESAPLGRYGTVMAVAAVALVVVRSPVALVAGAFAFGVGMSQLWNTLHARILQVRPGQAGTVTAVVTTLEFAGFALPVLFGTVADARGVGAGLACYAATAVALALLVTRAPRE
jgi:predicted MFS family arabinose efflux permease